MERGKSAGQGGAEQRKQVKPRLDIYSLYNSSRTAPPVVSPFVGADRGFGSSFASFSLFVSFRELAGLPSPDFGDLHGSGIGLVGSIGTCFTVPTFM